MTRKARLTAKHPGALRSSSYALSALVLALTGCATVPADPATDEEVKPPPQITTVGGRTDQVDAPAVPSVAASATPAAPVKAAAAAPAPAPIKAAPIKAAPPPVPQQAAPVANESNSSTTVVTPVDPLNPGQALLPDATAHTDLWVRVRSGFAMPNLESDLVSQHERWYADRPDYVRRMTERGSRYLYHVVEELQRRNMPTELALLPFIESAFNPQAMSSARASGMWQFMPGTGKDFELKQNMFRDDRRDVLASTRAAMDYLSRLNRMFNGDWQLTLAAYNWGEGNVKRAIAYNESRGLAIDYASLNMPAETRHYVPKLQAVKNIVAAPQNFSLDLPELQNHPYFLSVPIQRDIDVEVAARLAELSIEEFKSLNPQMNKPVILASGTPQILLPYDNAAVFARRLAEHTGLLASWTAWVAPRTMRSSDVAQEVGMTEEDLRSMNNIPPKMVVKAGSTLLVQRTSGSDIHDVPEHVAANAHMALAPDVPPLKKVTLRARPGDTVQVVARRYHLNSSLVARWNDVGEGMRFQQTHTLIAWLAPNATLHDPEEDDRAEAARQEAARQEAARESARQEAARQEARQRQLALAAKARAAQADEDEDEDKPTAKALAKRQLALAKAKAARINADDEEDDDKSDAKTPTPTKRQLALAKAKVKGGADDDEDDEKPAAKTPTKRQLALAKAKVKGGADDDEDDEKPAAKTPTKRQLALAKVKVKGSADDEEDDEKPAAKTPTKHQIALGKVKVKAKDDEEDDEDKPAASKRQAAQADRTDKRAQRASGAAKDVKIRTTTVARK